MKIFFDSSAFAKRYIDEPGSDSVEAICQNATELALSVICMPEIISAMNRIPSKFDGELKISEY